MFVLCHILIEYSFESLLNFFFRLNYSLSCVQVFIDMCSSFNVQIEKQLSKNYSKRDRRQLQQKPQSID